MESSGEKVACSACGRAYPVTDGVPNLLLTPETTAGQTPPGPAGRLLASLVALPLVYDLVQRLAGAASLARRVRPVLANASGAVVLDAGAGTGNLEVLLTQPAAYIWLDSDAQKLSGFRAKSTAPAVLGDATRIPFADNSVDWVLSVAVSHHLDDEGFARMLEELRRVARQRLFFLDAVTSPAFTSRMLWRYDRGRYPRGANVLRRELAARFSILSAEEFTILHRYLLVTASCED